MARVMGADHVAEANGKFEPQRPFNFKLVLPQDAGLGNAEDVELSVLSFSVPNISNEPIVIPFLNEDRKIAGAVTFENATLVMVDYVDPNVLGALDGWRKKVYDPETGGVGLARDYKFDMSMKMFGPDDQDSFSRLWRLVGIWPQSIQHGEFSMATRTDYKQVTGIFSVDRMYLEADGGSSGA